MAQASPRSGLQVCETINEQFLYKTGHSEINPESPQLAVLDRSEHLFLVSKAQKMADRQENDRSNHHVFVVDRCDLLR
jgi:hypothetical protein